MKKVVCNILAVFMFFSVFSFFCFQKEEPIKAVANSSLPEKHLILNADGSYGGSLNETLYGKGAPKNGEFDVENSTYYIVNDFYNKKSTNENYPLTLYPNFMPYQQTMENSSAFACLVMALNRLNKDIVSKYTELALVEKYEQLNGVLVKDSDVDAETLGNFVLSLGEGFNIADRTFGASLDRTLEGVISDNFASCLTKGDIALVRYRSPADYGWKIVIGLDQMGTESALDDILIFANPFDVSDHYQDGYSTARLSNFVVWWTDINDKFQTTIPDEMVIIESAFDNNFERIDRDTTPKQTQFELHHILNADGSYGGTRDKDKYGVISTKNGNRNVLYSTYYKINDFYNMKDEGSRLLLEKYNNYQQTMSASCGVCSMMSVLKYYGKKVDESLEVTLCDDYFNLSKKKVYPSGTLAEYNAEVLKSYGLKAVASTTFKGDDLTFPTYELYRDFLKENLEKDRPVMASIKNRGGHWVTIIGLDDMGTSNIYDDVIIISDSSDYWDHYQDGYNTYPATAFYRNHYSDDLDRAYSMVYLEKSPTNNALVIGIIAGVIVLAGLGVASVIIIKKKKAK